MNIDNSKKSTKSSTKHNSKKLRMFRGMLFFFITNLSHGNFIARSFLY